MKKKSKLQIAQDKVQASINETNKKIEQLGSYSNNLCIVLNEIQDLFDAIRNMPSEKKFECANLKKIRLNWKQQAEKIENDYKTETVKNAVPAWLGGGTLTASGGILINSASLALALPFCWVITGVSITISGLMFWKSSNDKEKIENIFTLISKRDVKSYKLAVDELNERITRIDNESKLLKEAIIAVESFGTDYDTMTEKQQYQLGAYLNLMLSSTQLLVNPIMGLQPKYDEETWNKFFDWKHRKSDTTVCQKFKSIIIFLANLLYKIDLDETDKKLLFKTFRKNKEMLSSMGIKKKEFTASIIDIAMEALSYIDNVNSVQVSED